MEKTDMTYSMILWFYSSEL